MDPSEKITDVISVLLSKADEVLALAESQRQYMQTLEAAALGLGQADPLADNDTERAFDWVVFRAEYEGWYSSCLSLMRSVESGRVGDFIQLYLADDPELPSIKTALLRGFSIENYYGFRDRVENQIAILSSVENEIARGTPAHTNTPTEYLTPYVDPDRIDELRAVNQRDVDLAKLIRLSEELNLCYANQCYFAVAMLARAIVDHIPPILGCRKFSEVANSYSGPRSFKESMQNLDNSLRKIADAHLHIQIRDKETLPNRTQVDFSNDLDVLLAEVVRVLK